MATTMKTYRGIKYRVQKLSGMTIFDGYDRGYRVIYALSQTEFRKKVSAYIARGETNQATPWNRKGAAR